SIGYPPREEERELLLSGGVEHLLADLKPVLSHEELVELQEQVTDVRVAPKLADYMLALADVTRQSGEFLLGVSTRAIQDLFRATQALALAEGRPFVVPDDVQRLAPAVLAHRVVVRRAAQDLTAAREAVERLVGQVPVPE
ncbi:MAG TPA: MoxR family ATPase, partial [Thermoanaerobaculia bacterium]